jgi:hypothetical protein
MTFEKCWEYNIIIHQRFIDFKQAYDSVNRLNLERALQYLGIPDKLVALCKEMTSGSMNKIVVEGKKSAPFAITSRVRQNDALAPVYLGLEYVTRESGLRRNNFIFTNSNKLFNLAFAEDLCIVARNQRNVGSWKFVRVIWVCK